MIQLAFAIDTNRGLKGQNESERQENPNRPYYRRGHCEYFQY